MRLEAQSCQLRTVLNCVLGKRGRERVIAEFSLDRVVREHMDIYRELLGDRWPNS